MRVLTLRSTTELPFELQSNIHYTFRMEHHTDVILKDRGASIYSSTISMDDPGKVIETIVKHSVKFPDISFLLDDLHLEEGTIRRLTVQNGSITGEKSGELSWDKE